MIIYKATNKINGKCYIGQTVKTLNKRIPSHKCDALTRNSSYGFHRALRKYGFDSFTWEILCECETKGEMNEMEYHYIKQYRSHGSENGYNMTWGGDGGPIMYGEDNPAKRPEVRKKISKALKGSNKGRSRIGGKNSPFAKEWEITFPDGKIENILCLKSFCKEYNLTYPLMFHVIKGWQKHHKGFSIKRIT